MRQRKNIQYLSVLHIKKADELFALITSHTGIQKKLIVSQVRVHKIVACRVVFTIAFKNLFPNLSFSTIGTLLGGLDETSVYHYKRICRNLNACSNQKNTTSEIICLLVAVLEKQYGIESMVESFIRESKPKFIPAVTHLRIVCKIFCGIKDYSGYDRIALSAKYGKDDLVLHKIAFTVVCKEFIPSSSHKFVASLIGVTDHARICYYRTKHTELCMSANQNLPEVIRYQKLLVVLRSCVSM